MRIESEPPFEITNAPDGVKHAVKENIQISVFPDVGEVKMRHKIGMRASVGESRWLYITLVDKGVNIYIHGTHVVVSEKKLLPTFTTHSREELMETAFKNLRAHKTEKNKYIVDTEGNRHVLNEIFEEIEMGIRSRLLAEMNHGAALPLGVEK